jgi:hypothetical protein
MYDRLSFVGLGVLIGAVLAIVGFQVWIFVNGASEQIQTVIGK